MGRTMTPIPDDANRAEAYRQTQAAADLLDAAAQNLGFEDVDDIGPDSGYHRDDLAALVAIRTAHDHLRSGECHRLVDRFEDIGE